LLLQIKAIKLNLHNPFTWSSGWRSPIYCDNRATLAFPEIRTFIKNNITNGIKEKFGDGNLIAGVATAGIPHGALIADAMDLPFVYVRSEAKSHGLNNKVEGKINGGEKVVVIEDLISTAKSSINAITCLKEAGCQVIGLAAIFNYGFQQAADSMAEANCPFFTLSDYESLLKLAPDMFDLGEEEMLLLRNWREDPGNWGQNK